MSEKTINTNEAVEATEEITKEDYIMIRKPKFLSKKAKETTTEEQVEAKKPNKVMKALKGAALVGLGAIAGIAGYKVVNNLGSDEEALDDEYVVDDSTNDNNQ